MTLHTYHPKILNFLYELTKLEKYMSYRELASSVKIDNKTVNPKTIQKWFKFLKEPYNHPGSVSKNKFDYFPGILYEKLGLMQLDVISEDVDFGNFPLLSFQNFMMWFFDCRINKNVLLTNYLLPEKSLNDINNTFKNLKKKKIIGKYNMYTIHSGFNIYSPLHKVIDQYGNFSPENNDPHEIDLQLAKFKSYFNSVGKIGIINEIKRNPLIIPITFEYQFEFYSSLKVWKIISEKFSDNIWSYFRKIKTKSNFVGIKRVQKTSKELKKYNLYNQIRIVYRPLELDKNFIVYFFLDFKDYNTMMNSLKEIALNSINIRISPREKFKAKIGALVNYRSLENIFNILEKLKIEKTYYLNFNKSLPLMSDKNYYNFDYARLFDPKKIEWKTVKLT